MPSSPYSMTSKVLTAAALILLLAVSPTALNATQATQPAQTTTATTTQRGTGSFLDHGVELMDSADRITLAWLTNQTQDNLTVPALEKVIQSSLLTLGVRKVLLDIGWQNYAVGAVPQEQWVSNWLSACDALGVQNLLYLGQLTQAGYGSTWAKSLIKADPAAQTYFYNGTAADYFSADNADVAKAIEVDLSALYSYYGSHPSWVGLGSGYPQSDPYFPANSTMPIMGYSNATLQAFANSVFFARDTNQSGFFDNSTGDLLYSSFKDVEPSQQMSSGVWMTSSGKPVYGSEQDGNRVAMRFLLPKNETSIRLGWYGDSVGQAGDLVALLVPDQNGSLVVSKAVANATEAASGIGTTAAWQPDVTFAGNFSAGIYWVVFSSPSSDSQNYIEVYIRDYQVGSYVALYQQGTSGLTGYTILWVKDGQGGSLEIYPYQNEYIPLDEQTFVATQSFNFNTVFLFLSDRHYNPTNGTLVITDITDGNSVVATGVLSQALTHGLQNWTPITLDKVVNAIPGDNYSISVTEPQNGDSWLVVLRGVSTNPPIAGFQGQGSSWLFSLDLMNLGQEHVNWGVITGNGVDSVTSNHPDAIQFLPSQNETLESISLLMKNPGANASTYGSGSLTIGIWTSTPDGSQPAQPLSSLNITASKIPENGWLNSSGLHPSLVGGDYYWVVVSTQSGSSFSLARLTSPYLSSVKVSDDGGKTWTLPAEGPSEYSYSLVLSRETLGPGVSDIPQVLLSETGEFAQPLQVSSATEVKGIYLGVIVREHSSAPNDHVLVSIRPSNGNGEPSQSTLASGVYYGNNITLPYSPYYIQFTSVTYLSPGQAYWIVVQPVGGSYYVLPDVYLSTVTASSPNAMVSDDSGFTWHRYSNQTTALSYILASPVQQSPSFDTKQLYQDLEEYHDFPITNGTLKGFPAFIESSELALINEASVWFDQTTGRNWEVAVSSQPAVLAEANYSAITPLTANAPFANCAEVEQDLLEKVPVTNSRFYDVGSLQLLESCGSIQIASFAELLGYLPFYATPQSANASTFVWQTGGGSPQEPNLYYSISGTTGGPFVIWASNAGGTTAGLSLSLNATQLGVGDKWVVFGLTDSTLTAGTGRSLTIYKQIPATSWYALIVTTYNASLVASYSDVTIQRQLQYPNQRVYSTGGAESQPVIMLISSKSPVGAVLLDSKDNLTTVSEPSFYASPEGWYYDNSSGVLLVKFPSSGNDTIRVLLASPPVVHVQPVPIKTVVEAVGVLLAVDLALVVYTTATRSGPRSTATRTPR